MSTFLLMGIIAVLATISYAGYTFWQKSSAELEVQQLDRDLAENKNTISKYESERILQAVSAKQTVDNLKASSMVWSQVIKDVRNTLPKADDGQELVDVLSYSGSSDSDISMTLKTIAGSENPFLDVAKLIASFDKSANFENPFVPSIGIGEDKEGNTILSFSLTTKYLKTDVVNALEKTEEKLVEPAVSETPVDVPVSETPVVEAPVDTPMAR